jgi:nicotinamidase-related amidase
MSSEGSPSATALLIIDMINDFDMPDRDALLEHTSEAAAAIEQLRPQADDARVPVVYVNDNYGHWHSDRDQIIEFCCRPGSAGRVIAERLSPREQDYFVIKPQFSGFYATNLPVLLPKLGVSRLVITGVAADICVLFTAADAHMRDYALWVPRDAVASSNQDHRDWALGIIEKSMGAETTAVSERSLSSWLDDNPAS